ncbi:quinone-dependent dihydroorotate dehydrogenase [Nitratifractor salsuginis]|uniref:Dihydroorotate dehydrogenase (quinone) n=1 Tax=Nitratifractor salsuginis (strain DSM 16511 / JCM 12458 / E9I37-1) TaxID=749222 RepID=E6WZQ3_NITSE|nr:quinone-dependent dihydroorotate dehydrogenase [Nitratifractor salsuginis]ADV46694.1 dihydroorotate oxidase A [Nitratifractor salsuginis DSM 16511]
MSLFSYETVKSLLFKLDPETAHSIAGLGLRALPLCPPAWNCMIDRYFVDDPVLHQRLFGRTFRNPVGLAAGFDKNGDYVKGTPALGFGFTEIGTVTPRPQPGNPRPRLFRLVEERSVQNAMGFNNKGAYHMVKRLKRLRFFDYPVGINIGKNKTTPERETLNDYETLFKTFRDYSDYIVINISSPNTPGLRDLQNEAFIREVFRIGTGLTDKPILLKIAPDMSAEQALELCRVAVEAGAAGIIATNTTVDYSLTPNAQKFGGISGTLLTEKSRELFAAIGKEFHDKTLLISVGGIDSAEEAYRRIRMGASLVQVYSLLIYEGPKLIRDINRGLIRLLKADGFSNISEAVGAEWR